ncbi:MAG: hypothetical protein C0392_16290 [Syntrophus sp. (in: bacteria)]|nr:hypothetical protein [Syntrophus sp. (in: bacteria)]
MKKRPFWFVMLVAIIGISLSGCIHARKPEFAPPPAPIAKVVPPQAKVELPVTPPPEIKQEVPPPPPPPPAPAKKKKG